MKKLFKVKALNTKEEVKKINEIVGNREYCLSEYSEFKDDLDLFDTISCIEIEKDIEYVYITTYEIMTRVALFMVKMGYKLEIFEVTKDIFENRIDLSFATEEQNSEVENIIFENFDSNDVLDKINEVGIDSLSNIDRKILETV
jgi:hypothetical protein